MESHELRIGNYVIHNSKYGKNIKQVKGIIADIDRQKNDSIIFFNPGGLTYPKINECEPIFITKEWLIKFGFVKIPESDSYQTANNDDVIYYIDDETEGLYYVSFGDDPMFCMEDLGGLKYISYIHELQNIYFALIGEELTIKE